MKKRVSIVDARRELGRLAQEVHRTGQPVVLTRRGQAVARIVPEPAASTPRARAAPDAFAGLRGSLRLNCSFGELQEALRGLRDEFARNLERRAAPLAARRRRTNA